MTIMDITDEVVKYMNNEFDDFVDYISELNLTDDQRKTLIEYINDLLYLSSKFINSDQLNKRLLNAAISDLHDSTQYPSCRFCTHYKKNYPYNHPCDTCDHTNYWEWRGLCPENVKNKDEQND